MHNTLHHYLQLLHRVDTWFGQCLAVAPLDISCTEGCSACCRGLFDITLLDAYLLQSGFQHLPATQRSAVLTRVHWRLEQLQQQWPQLQPPYILNLLPNQQWMEMPEDDLTPCPLLGADGLCLLYDYRPLTCRLHGLAQVDVSGEVFSDGWCTLNFTSRNPLAVPELRAPFREFFQREVQLLSRFSQQLLGRSHVELDTFIPLALLIDFTALGKIEL
ncbi:MAG: YkgJ family cysteine cluster protein [Desulfuromonas sp.]|nr:YkgJ family cysteine cluster protein [Desulfuromonas sp.]